MAGGTVVVVTVAVFGASATDNTGPILAFVGAVLVALVAAYTADRRQARALEAESTRLAQQLEHESARHQQQLQNDRELADLAAVRSALDDAALALQRVDLPPSPLITEDDRTNAIVVRADLEAIRSRLTVRFGRTHTLARQLQDAEQAMGHWFSYATVLAIGNDHEADHDKIETKLDEAEKAFRAAAAAFLDAAAKTAGARLP